MKKCPDPIPGWQELGNDEGAERGQVVKEALERYFFDVSDQRRSRFVCPPHPSSMRSASSSACPIPRGMSPSRTSTRRRSRPFDHSRRPTSSSMRWTTTTTLFGSGRTERTQVNAGRSASLAREIGTDTGRTSSSRTTSRGSSTQTGTSTTSTKSAERRSHFRAKLSLMHSRNTSRDSS